MKKTFKILLYFFGFILLVCILGIVFHSSIISYTLKKVIAGKSNGKVELTLDSFNVNIVDGTIVIGNPSLVLQDVYMNETKSIKLDRVVFEKIEIDQLDIRRLFFKRDIIAKKFLIDKPEFWLTEEGNSSTSSFHPEKLIETLNQNPEMFSKILFRIENIEINYGSIMLSEFITEDADPGLVDFTLFLEHFDSQPEKSDTNNRILFSDEFRFRLRNLHKELESGYTLDIDSAYFSSTYSDLIIGGASLQPTENELDQNSVGISVRKLVLNDIGLEEIQGLEDLNLSSIILSDGEFINYINISHETKPDTTGSNKLDLLAKVLNDFSLDSIDISNFNYYNIRDFKDTVIYTHDVEFVMTNIKVDSGLFEDIFRSLTYDKIILHTGNLAINNLIPGFGVTYQSLSYTNLDRKFRMSGIRISSDSLKETGQPVNLSVPVLQITGATFVDIMKREKQHLVISVRNPEGSFDVTQFLSENTAGDKTFLFPDYLILDKIILENGNFNFSRKDDFLAGLTGLNVEMDGLKLPERASDRIRYNSVRFNYNKAETYFEKASVSLTTGAMRYDANELWLQDISLKTKAFGEGGGLQIQKMKLDEFDLDRLVFKKELHLGQLAFGSPQLDGTLFFKNLDNTDKKTPLHQMLIPLAFEVGSVLVEKGGIDTEILLDKGDIKLKTNYDLKLGPLFSIKGDSLKSVLEDLHWRLELTDLDATAADHRLNSKRILTDSYRSELTIEGLSAAGLPAVRHDPENLEIRTLLLPFVDVSGLDYDLLVRHDSIAFCKIVLENPNINIRLPKKVQNLKSAFEKKLDLRDYFVFSYDTISTSNLHLLIEKPGDSSHAVFSLKKLNLVHHFAKQAGGSFMKRFGFDFAEFSQFDTIINKYLLIQDGRLGLDEDFITIRGIEGGDIVDMVNSRSVAGTSGMTFKSDEIVLTDISIAETLPSQLKVGKLLIGDLDFKLKQVPSQSKKASFKINLELMNRFSRVMTNLRIDTTIFKDISLTYQTIADTAMYTIDFDSISLVINRIDFDTAMIRQTRPNLIENLTVDLRGRTRITHDSLYEIQTGRIHYDFPNHVITVDSFNMIPRYEEEAFFKKAVYQTTRTKLFSQKIEINNLDIDELFRDDHIHLSSINVFRADAEMYRDKRYEIRPGTFKKLPREALMSISQKFTVDSLHIIDSYLKYKQIEEKSFVPGEIFFNQLNVNAYDITNVLKEGQRLNMKLEADGRIMDNARMDATVFFPLHNDSTAFWMAAKTETIDLTVLNSMTENLLGLGITKGVGSVDAQYISGTDSLAHGNLIFRYKKLELKRYNRKKSQLKKTGFINFLINDLVVKSNNPKFARKPRVGQVYFVRETEKGVVAYLFRSILTGLTSTLGFNNKEQRMERKEDRKRK